MQKKASELKVLEILIISLIGLSLANLLTDALKSLFFKNLKFDENSSKDKFYALLIPLSVLFLIIYVTKPKESSLF